FKELHARARQVESMLRKLQIGRGAMVAIVMEKGWEQVVAALAILQAGGVYVPIEADWPADRIQRVLAACEGRVVLTQSSIGRALDIDPAIKRLNVDGIPPLRGAAAAPATGSHDDLAYVIFTSGSTGAPKGVMIPHRGAYNTVDDINTRFSVGPS